MMESICWDCVRAGMCKKPVDGWVAIDTYVNGYSENDKSYLVIACPLFKVEEPKNLNQPYLGKQPKRCEFEQKKRVYRSESEILTKSIKEYSERLKRNLDKQSDSVEQLYRKHEAGTGGDGAKKPVIARNIETGETRQFDSMNKARELGISFEVMRDVLRGKRESANGWELMYGEIETEGRKIIATDTRNGKAKEYSSVSAAVKDGFERRGVKGVLSGTQKSHFHYVFEWGELNEK